jgi:hypothetical protein
MRRFAEICRVILPDFAPVRTQAFFHNLAAEGTKIESNSEMIRLEGQGRPNLMMGWGPETEAAWTMRSTPSDSPTATSL